MVEAMRRVRARLETLPGVISAVPDAQAGGTLSGYGMHPEDRVPADVQETVRLSTRHVTAAALQAMATPLLLGEAYAETDTTAMQPGVVTHVVIGDELARKMWAGANPLGRRLQPRADDSVAGPTLTVVGVYDELPDDEAAAEQGHRVFLPPTAAQLGAPALLVRTGTNAEALMPAIREVLRAELPGMTVMEMRTHADIYEEERRAHEIGLTALAVAGLLALGLAAIGIYAVIALAVGQRTGEIAVRMAIGAHARMIVRSFVGSGLRLGVFGLAVGLPLSLLGLHLMLLEEGDSVSVLRVAFAAGGGVLAVMAAAAWVPARRAAGVDPAAVLRRE